MGLSEGSNFHTSSRPISFSCQCAQKWETQVLIELSIEMPYDKFVVFGAFLNGMFPRGFVAATTKSFFFLSVLITEPIACSALMLRSNFTETDTYITIRVTNNICLLNPYL